MKNQDLPKNLPAFIGHFLKPYRAISVLFIFLCFCAGFWGPFNNMIIKHIINLLPQVSSQGISIVAWPAAWIVINFLIFDNVTWRTVQYINYKYQAVIKSQIINETLGSVLNETHQFFQDRLSGRIANQITTLADNIEKILCQISLDFIRGISLLIVSFGAAYYVNPRFFYTLLIWFVVFFTISLWMSMRVIKLSDDHASAESKVSGQLVDGITNNVNIRIFAKKEFELSRINKYLRLSINTFRDQEFYLLLLYILQGLMIAAMMGFSAYFLVYLYGKGQITIGDFALILGISMELGHMTWYTMSRVDEFNQCVGKCKQSLKALLINPDLRDRDDAKELQVEKGQIVFDNVKFHYKGAEPLFQNKSVVIEAGQKVGLVGFSGSGKTTFVNLILRLYDITEGKILIDNQDLKDVTQNSLRRKIGLIPQEPTLFHRTLIENIRYAKTDATNEEVIRAAKRAHAHEFIATLSQGYETMVGERGIKLSGGQRQRIAIARAFLKNAPILILDEATSQLDSVTEKYIQESLWELMQNKTTIVVAHRLSTLLHMDRIIVFDKGSIVEDGTHTQLLDNKGLYYTLWNEQVGGFLLDSGYK